MSEFDKMLNKRAVALKYDEQRGSAPVVVASGMGYVAEKIVEMANEKGIPVYEDNTLATTLSQLELGAQIPEELYQVIVDIYVFFLKYKMEEPVKETAQENAPAEDPGAKPGNSENAGDATVEQQNS